jgi:hypothetical protein
VDTTTKRESPPAEDSSLHKVVMDDLRRTELRRDYLQEIKQLYYFYVDEERRAKLDGMGRIRRAFHLLIWLVKSLLMKLSPARRLMLLVAFLCNLLFGPMTLNVGGVHVSTDLRPLGFLLLLVVLMLELKDKLLAKDEIQVARKVQLALLPQRQPEIPGWQIWSHSRPANDVGGDLVDYIALDGFRHAVIVGDVAGKGLGAALLTAKLQATLRALVPDSPSLDDLGRKVNAILHRDGIDNRYATLFFAELAHHSGHVRYLNAGHDPPYVLRAQAIERLHASSYPLGILGAVQYEEGSLDLRPGEMILAYSDGLTEAKNEAGEEFGSRRLEALLGQSKGLAADVIGPRLLAEVDRFLGIARAHDDLSLVVMTRR